MSLTYPYLVTDAYPGTEDPLRSRPVGQGVYVQIVQDHGGVVRSPGPEQSVSHEGSIAAALPEALINLERLLRSGVIGSRVFPNGPGGMPFALFGGHWGASSALMLPSLVSLLGPHLGEELVASVPHREALLVFPAADARSRDVARAFVHDQERDGANPLTPGLFALTANGPLAVD